jgi:putative MATE family efflux protein
VAKILPKPAAPESPQDVLPAIEPVPTELAGAAPFETPVAEAIVAPASAAAAALAHPGDTPLTEIERTTLRRRVLALSWPVIIENLLQSLIGFVDTALVGHLGTDALAGVGGAQQIVWLVTTALSAVMMGATVLVAHAIGAQKPAEARRVFKQALVLSAGVAVVLTTGLHALAEPAVRLLGLDAQAAADGILYLQISALTLPVLVGMFTGSAVLRGAGDTRTPMFITAFINVINAVAAWWMIYGFGPIPAMGVAGSAWAAGVARLIGCLLLAWVFVRPGQLMNLRGPGWRFDLGLVKRMLNIGLPTAAEQFMLSFGITLYGIIVIGLGTNVYATQRASMMIVQMAFLPGFGFAMAATTLVGQAMGAGKIRQAEEGTWIATRWCMLLMGTIGVTFGLFGEPLMHLFSSDPEVTRLGGAVLFIAAWNQPFMALAQVLAGGLRGAGDTRYPMIVTMLSVWAVRLPVGWLLGIALGWGLQGIYLGYVLDTVVRAVLVWWRWRHARWKAMRV